MNIDYHEMPREMNASFVPGAPESQKYTTLPTAVSSTLITRPWPIRLERISCAVSHVGHNSESILGMNDSVVKFTVLSRLIRLICIEKHLCASVVFFSGAMRTNEQGSKACLFKSRVCFLYENQHREYVLMSNKNKAETISVNLYSLLLV